MTSPPPRPHRTVGREALLDAAAAAALGRGRQPRGVVLVGPGGIGKTVMASALAERLAPHFPDGQAWVSLATAERPGPDVLLDALLAHLAPGTPPESGAFAGKLRRYQSVLEQRRRLVVLDDVLDEGQVEDLLPPPSTSALVIVSRSKLDRLPLPHLEVPGLDPGAAVDLLRAASEQAGALADDDVAAALVRAVDGHPLSVQLLGARLALDDVAVDDLLRSVRDETERGRLSGDASGASSLQAAFEVSYASLSRSSADVFRRLGLLLTDAPTFSELVEQTGLGPARLHPALNELSQAGLLVVRNGRYQMHPVARAFARERLVDQSAERHKPSRPTAPFEMPTLEGLLRHGGSARELDEHISLHEYALRTARESSDERAAIKALAALGTLHDAAGRSRDAADALRAAISAAESVDDRFAVAQLELALAQVLKRAGELGEAERLAAHSSKLLELLVDDRLRSRALTTLGDIHWKRSDVPAAQQAWLDAATTVSTQGAVPPQILMRLGLVNEAGGEHEAALELYEAARTTAEQSGEVHVLNDVLRLMGGALVRLGHVDGAEDALTSSFDGFRRLDDRPGAARSALALGALALGTARPAKAEQWFERVERLGLETLAQLRAVAAFGRAMAVRDLDGQSAAELLEKAVALFRDSEDAFGEAHALAALARELDEAGEAIDADAARATAQALVGGSSEALLEPGEALTRMAL